jgi:hypothetical protein
MQHTLSNPDSRGPLDQALSVLEGAEAPSPQAMPQAGVHEVRVRVPHIYLVHTPNLRPQSPKLS